MTSRLKALSLHVALCSSLVTSPVALAAPFPAASAPSTDAPISVDREIFCETAPSTAPGFAGWLAQQCDPQPDDMAQNEAPIEDSEAWEAYVNSPYTYWDAKVLANFWNVEVGDGKLAIGRKMIWGGEMVGHLERALEDGRAQLLDGPETLDFFFESGYSYEDAQALAEFWGLEDAYQGKLKIDQLLIMGEERAIDKRIREARQR